MKIKKEVQEKLEILKRTKDIIEKDLKNENYTNLFEQECLESDWDACTTEIKPLE